MDQNNEERKKLFYWDRLTEEGGNGFEGIIVVFFVLSSMISFYAYSIASIDMWNILLMFFSLSISLKQIFTIIVSLVPFLLVYPIPFAFIAYYGIRAKNFRYRIPLVASFFSVAAGFLFFEFTSSYLVFALSYIIGAFICGFWANIRYRELSSLRIYRASTRAASQAYLIIKIGIIAAVVYTMASSDSLTSDFMDGCMDSYASLSKQMTEKQLRKQVEESIEAQIKVQNELFEDFARSLGSSFKSIGVEKLGEIEKKELEILDNSSLIDEKKQELESDFSDLLFEQKDDWSNKVDEQVDSILSDIREQQGNETRKQLMVERYMSGMGEDMLTQENVKASMEQMLKEHVILGGRQVVLYDFMEQTFPLLIVLVLWGMMGMAKKMVFLPLVGLYTEMLSRVLLRDESN
ncbi:MAG: hypothetical protein B6U97_00050 [Candidatus Altiarchaeales archaeon ex4484_96]|nr:MAG: hypothetical protein B6U97_00050 [Candidatus Altiarchaeales archaeon ex4484_96]